MAPHAIVRCPRCERDSNVIGHADYFPGQRRENTSAFRYQFRCYNGHTFWAVPCNKQGYFILDGYELTRRH